jgi:hypothetical protein
MVISTPHPAVLPRGEETEVLIEQEVKFLRDLIQNIRFAFAL